MPDKQIFFDPQRKRWKRLRRILDIIAVVSTLVLAVFIFNVLRNQHLPELLLPVPKHNYKALNDRTPLLRAPKAPPPPQTQQQPPHRPPPFVPPRKRRARPPQDRPQTLRYPLQHRRRSARGL